MVGQMAFMVRGVIQYLQESVHYGASLAVGNILTERLLYVVIQAVKL